MKPIQWKLEIKGTSTIFLDQSLDEINLVFPHLYFYSIAKEKILI